MSLLLQVENLTKSFGEKVLLDSISFNIAEGDKIGLIAKNGSGKTTLMNILAKKDSCDSGVITTARNLKIAYLEQDPFFDPNITVMEACFNSGNEITDLIKEYENVLASGDHSKLDEVLQQMDVLQAWDYEFKVKQILGQLNITNFDQRVSSLSGGQMKRVALANVLITEPDLIILDEPTNHLDLKMVEWLEGNLKRSKLALLIVTHDRYFLDKVCTEVLEIDLRKIYSYKGNYSYFLEKREERLNAQQQEVDKANNLLRKELEWLRRQPKARGTKSKSRIEAYYDLEKKAQSQRDNEQILLKTKGQYIGKKIFEAKDVTKSFDDIKIVDKFNYVFSRYEKLGIIGANGTGKSSFVKLLLNEIKPDSGSFDIGETIKFGYYSQDGLSFNDDMKVIDAITDIAEVIDMGGGNKMTASQFLQFFLFSPTKQHDFIKKLSGGEKRRLYLCSILMKSPNFLILDEPTNDLDIQTLNVLEEYLVTFNGCVIVVSHDRYFMDKVVDHLLVFKGQAEIKDFPGNYTDYREWEEIEEQEKKKLEANIVNDKNRKTEEKVTNNVLNVGKTKTNTEQKKLSYKERRELEELEKSIEQLEKEKEMLQEEMSSGMLENNILLEKSERMAIIIDEIDEKTIRWMELSEKK